MQLEVTVIIREDPKFPERKGKIIGYRNFSDYHAKNEHDYEKIYKEMKHLEDYWIKGINNTIQIHKNSVDKK